MKKISFFFLILFQPINTASARVYDLYRADYQKGAFCSVIGGACAADVNVESSFLQNPASLVAGSEDFGFDADYNDSANLEPGMKGGNTVSETQYMGGVAKRFGIFGVGAGITGNSTTVTSTVSVVDDNDQSHDLPLTSSSSRMEITVPFAYTVRKKTSLALAMSAAFSQQSYAVSNIAATSAKTDLNFRFTFGFIEQITPRLRFGSWYKAPINTYSSIFLDTPALGVTLHYREDFDLRNPWIFANGIAYSPWDDGREILFDLDLVGDTLHGVQLTYDTFSTAIGDRGVRTKGRFVVLEPRLGVKLPGILPGILERETLFFGSYLETSRWEGLPSRLHGTFGISDRHLGWIELMAGLDVSRDFFQLFFTFR